MSNDCAYWRKTPHVFIKAHWGPKYCDLCLDPRRRVIHLTDLPERDPRNMHAMVARGYHVACKNEVVWKIQGWSDDGASCSYGGYADGTKESTEARARKYMEDGDEQGHKYDHYLVEEVTYYTACDVNWHPVEEL